ncbi:MAG: aminoacyl-tRNA hydrolase [Planctomycetota bacterium]
MTRLVVGLGNPGAEYEWTRHNVGFHVLDRLASLRGGPLFQTARQLDGYHGPGPLKWARIRDPEAFLLKPETYMNLSGDVVAPLVRHLFQAQRPPGLGHPPEAEPREAPDLSRMLVVYDDLDLELGKLRIRPHGGAGGHKGMRSIIECLASDRFPRLRVGIGRAGTDAARHVLRPFPPDERVEAEISVSEAAEAILDWLASGDLEGCMTRYHSRWNRES